VILQRDPSGTLKKLLAEAVALGHTVEGIGQGVDIAAITAAIKAELGAKETAKEPTAEEVTAQADAEVNNFYSRYPDARTHDALMAAVLRDHPDLSLEAAYFQLKDAFAERGYDWSRTLEDNAKASSDVSQEHDNNSNGSGNKPLPSGGNVGNNADLSEKRDDVVMSENADMGDIIRSAMKESGLRV
jgi:hypothetical protein